jgi:Cas7 group CRISPR-associated protein Csh2
MNQENSIITRATGLLVIEVRNSNPNGDPDRESDPRCRSHDQRGIITGVSFKRKARDLVEAKEGPVWGKMRTALGLSDAGFCILESRKRGFDEVQDASEAWRNVIALIERERDGEAVKNKYWDARLFGATFLESGDDARSGGTNGRKHIRTGVVHVGLGLSVAPIRIQRDTLTKKASAQEEKDRGMAPLGHRVVEHAVYIMPFFINPTAASQSGCTLRDVELWLRLIPYAYPHTRSAIRPFVEVTHAWYGEHRNPLGSFSEFQFIDALTPKRKGNPEIPSVDTLPLKEQYDVPAELPKDLKEKVQNFTDLCDKLPLWCREER